ncbi:unnamed protein product [Parnassius apollo]|uniref:(apollo) hypothetical protein n=1 Tax=Parnassius apollo TaxID=110799 RepID=A0A8S3XGV2_PARAO|nr:unnamed protein product [Parnassius apollo]
MGGKKKHKTKRKTEELEATSFDVNSDINVDDIDSADKDIVKSHKRKHASYENNTENQYDMSSDTESKPKKPKKKKNLISSDSSEKKKKKSIRQMKREKHAERQAAAEAVAKDQLKSQCLNYLSQWKYDRPNWKFMKAKQVWLFKNKFSSNLIPDASWPLLLEYFESAKGNIRNLLLADANKIIKQMDDWTDLQNNEENNVPEDQQDSSVTKPHDTVYNRARSLIQCLEE